MKMDERTLLTADEGCELVSIARDAVECAARREDWAPPETAGFREGASFVTLYVNGALRGCLGSMMATKPLDEDVAYNAFKAATSDPRFPAFESHELDGLEVKVAVLTPLEPLEVSSFDELLEELEPDTGVLIKSRLGRATFLPAVWQKLHSGQAFLDQLWLKAGFRPGTWPPDLEVFTYGTQQFSTANSA